MIDVIAFWDSPNHAEKKFLIEINNNVTLVNMRLEKEEECCYDLCFNGFSAFTAFGDELTEIVNGNYNKFFSEYYRNNTPSDYISEYKSFLSSLNNAIEFVIRYQHVFEVKTAISKLTEKYKNSNVVSITTIDLNRHDFSTINYKSCIIRYDALEYFDIHFIVDNDKVEQTICQLVLLGYKLHEFNY